MAQYDGNGSRSPQWWPSRYGADDTLGAGNELTPERTLEALKLPREGRVIEIAQTLEVGAPAFPPREHHQLVLCHYTLNPISDSQMSGLEEHLTGTQHIGCHVDGLGHVGIDGHFYNGTHYRDFYNPAGLDKLGIEAVRPWVTRGVCLDIAGLEGTEMLPAGFCITPEHLEAACERQGVEVRAGDAVLLHTGWGALWMQDEKYDHEEPGAGWDACHWLTDRHVSMVSADNWAFEVIPFEQPNRAWIGHQHLIAETGTFIVENIKTHELVAGRHSEFLFVMAPNKLKGATASQVSPLCIV
jgi:kynurenine formamidase